MIGEPLNVVDDNSFEYRDGRDLVKKTIHLEEGEKITSAAKSGIKEATLTIEGPNGTRTYITDIGDW